MHDRVLIRADREDNTPTQTASGLYTARSLASAVDGSDPGGSWFVGTIVQCGPGVNRPDIRDQVVAWLTELEHEGHDLVPAEIRALKARVTAYPEDIPDPLRVGDRVVFSWASGQQLMINGETYLTLRAGDVLGIVEEE